MARNKKTAIELPEVSVSDDGEVRHLHLGTPWIQGSMRVATSEIRPNRPTAL